VNLMQHSLEHGTPDAVFPNNWFSTHSAGEAHGCTAERSMVLYPMKCPNRAAERRHDLIDLIRARGYGKFVDFSGLETTEKKYFEGTGVLVLDRVNGVAYVALSERADKSIAERWRFLLLFLHLSSLWKEGFTFSFCCVVLCLMLAFVGWHAQNVKSGKELIGGGEVPLPRCSSMSALSTSKGKDAKQSARLKRTEKGESVRELICADQLQPVDAA
jgi:hypothetical protein